MLDAVRPGKTTGNKRMRMSPIGSENSSPSAGSRRASLFPYKAGFFFYLLDTVTPTKFIQTEVCYCMVTQGTTLRKAKKYFGFMHFLTN